MAVDRGGIGARLRAGREKLGLTVLQAAEKLHLDARILESLEAESFEALGATVYARGHLRHYAELVGESADELTALYSHASRTAQPDLTRIAKAPSSYESSRLVVPALMVLAVFAVAGAVWWVLSLQSRGGQARQAMEITPTPPVPLDGSSTGNTSTAARATVTGPQPGTAVPGTPGMSRTNTPPGASGSPASGNSTSGGSTPGAVATGALAGGTALTAAPHSGSDSRVTLRFSADSWTEVYDAAGARLFYDVGAANSVHELKGSPPLRVVLGNASGVVVEVNGHDTPIAKLSNPDGSAQFVINRSGRAVRAKPAADGG